MIRVPCRRNLFRFATRRRKKTVFFSPHEHYYHHQRDFAMFGVTGLRNVNELSCNLVETSCNVKITVNHSSPGGLEKGGVHLFDKSVVSGRSSLGKRGKKGRHDAIVSRLYTDRVVHFETHSSRECSLGFGCRQYIAVVCVVTCGYRSRGWCTARTWVCSRFWCQSHTPRSIFFQPRSSSTWIRVHITEKVTLGIFFLLVLALYLYLLIKFRMFLLTWNEQKEKFIPLQIFLKFTLHRSCTKKKKHFRLNKIAPPKWKQKTNISLVYPIFLVEKTIFLSCFFLSLIKIQKINFFSFSLKL